MLILPRKFRDRLHRSLSKVTLESTVVHSVVVNLEAVSLAPKAKAKASEGQRSLGGLVESSPGAGTGLVSTLWANLSEGRA